MVVGGVERQQEAFYLPKGGERGERTRANLLKNASSPLLPPHSPILTMCVVWWLLAVWACTTSSSSFECDLWLAPSKIDGKGIFAGRAYEAGEDLDFGVSLPVPYQKIVGTMLSSYVHAGPTESFFEEELEYSFVNLGITMIMNHHSPPARTYHFHEEDESEVLINDTFNSPFATYPATWHSTEINLSPGDEVFNVYSEDDSWFLDKDLVPWDDSNVTEAASAASRLTLAEIEATGHCMTQVYVNTSHIVRAGLGLFAARDFEVGETVTVSPVLVLPRSDIEEMQITSLVQNYCIAGAESEVVLLPIGTSMMANHALVPNMEMSWHLWKADDKDKLDKILAHNVSTISETRFTQLDLAFLATHKIASGDELTVNYGQEWVEAWATYLAEYIMYLTHNPAAEEENHEAPEAPIFRHFIASPPNLMPTHWNIQYETVVEEAETVVEEV